VERDGFTVGAMAKVRPCWLEHGHHVGLVHDRCEIDPVTLRIALQHAVAASFNLMTVDGATSTNDTVLVLAAASAPHPEPTH